MAHPQQQNFVANVKSVFPHFFSNTRVVEIGSLNINGTVRNFFENCKQYVGVDIGEGPGVDIVVEGQNYDAPSGSFDVAISAECFEHNPYWVETFQNMIRLVRPGGLVIFTCATYGRAEHGTSRTDIGSSPLTCAKGWDYYKNLGEEDFKEHFNFEDLFIVHKFSTNMVGIEDLYFWGIKR